MCQTVVGRAPSNTKLSISLGIPTSGIHSRESRRHYKLGAEQFSGTGSKAAAVGCRFRSRCALVAAVFQRRRDHGRIHIGFYSRNRLGARKQAEARYQECSGAKVKDLCLWKTQPASDPDARTSHQNIRQLLRILRPLCVRRQSHQLPSVWRPNLLPPMRRAALSAIEL